MIGRAGTGSAQSSTGSFIISSSRANALRTVCSCCQAPTTCRIGASTRAARMVAAIRAPIDMLAGDDRTRADIDDQQRCQVLQDLAGARDQAAEIAGTKSGPGALRKLLLEPALHLRLEPERLDGERLAHRLAEAGRLGGRRLEARLDQRLLAVPGEHRQQPEQRHRAEHDQPQPHVQVEQHADEHADEGEIDQQQRHLAREELAHTIELPGALEDLAGRHLLERAQRQVQQMVDDLAAERRVETAAGVARDVAAQAAQAPFEHEQRDHAERQDVEGLQRVVVDHFVVDGHQEQRRRQRHHVDHDRGDAEFPQHRAQAPHDRSRATAGGSRSRAEGFSRTARAARSATLSRPVTDSRPLAGSTSTR